MTFVYPLLLGGLLLAGLPVLLHFLIRQKPKTLLFPAFRFLMQKQRSNTRNLRLRHLLLLLLRIALLALLCLALARPRLIEEQFGLSRERPVALVLVFDTSASMGYKSGEVTRLDLAKKRSLELLDQLPPDCRVLVLDSSDAGNYGRVDWLKSLEQARQRIKALATRPDSTPVTRALDEAYRRFDEGDRVGDDPEAARLPRLVCVFTDRTKASWDGSANTKRGAGDDAVKVQAMLFDVGIDDPVDLAITQVELPAHYLGGMRQSFDAGEKDQARRGSSGHGQGTLFPQSSVRSTIAKSSKRAPSQAGEAADNDVRDRHEGIAARPPSGGSETRNRERPVAVQQSAVRDVRDSRTAAHPRVDRRSHEEVRLRERAESVSVYAVDRRSASDAVELNSYDAVFLDGVGEPSEKLWTALTAYVQTGRGLGIIPGGDAMKASAYNTAAAQELMPAKIGAKVAPTAGHEGRWNGAAWDLDNPFLRRFRSWFTRGDGIVSNLGGVSHYWEAKPLTELGATVLITYDDERPAIVERRFAKGGTVLLLTTPMEPQTTEWNQYYSTVLLGLPGVDDAVCAPSLSR